MLMRISFSIIDVRDVAAVEIAAMGTPSAAGNRYIVDSGKSLWVKEIADIMRKEFEHQGYRIPSRNLPKALAWVVKFFDDRLKALYPMIGKVITYNNERVKQDFGIEFHDVKSTFFDFCYSAIELGVVEKTAGYVGPTKYTAGEKDQTSSHDTTGLEQDN